MLLSGICGNIDINDLTVVDLFVCGSTGVFGFDTLLTFLAVIIIIAYLVYFFRLPPMLGLFVGIGAIYSFTLIFGQNDIMNLLLIVSMLGLGAYITFTIFEHYNKSAR